MPEGPLRLSNEDFWFDPYKNEDEIIHEMADEDVVGLILDAPSAVDIAQRVSLPLMGITAETLRDTMIHETFQRAAILVAVRLDRNECFVNRAERPRDRPPNHTRQADEDPGEGGTYESFRLNMRTRLQIPWIPSSWAITVLQRDVVSNMAFSELVARRDAYEDPAVLSFLQPRTQTAYPRPVWPPAAPRRSNASNPQPTPWYKPLELTPPIPDEPGIALAIERVQVVDDDTGGCILYGSFRLPVLSREIVRPCKETTEELEALADEQARVDALNDEDPQPTEDDDPEPGGDDPDFLTDDEVDWPPEHDEDRVVDPVLINLARDARSGEWVFPDQYGFDPPQPEGPRESGHVWQDVGEEGATAVIPIAIVATGVKIPDPLVAFIHVPSYDPVSGGETVVTGQFAVDLLGFSDSDSIRRQTSYVYAFSGSHRAGPCPVALLAPDML